MDRKDTYSYFFAGIFALMMLSSCARLPIVASHRHDAAMDAEKNFSSFDPKSGLRYMVSNDSTHLFVSFDTDNPGIQMNVLTSGARISVDTNGKKKGTAYLRFPIIDREKIQQRPDRGGKKEDSRRNDGGGQKQDRQQIGKMPLRAVFVCGEKQYAFDNKYDQTAFKTILLRDSLDVLYYMVGIPFKEIHPDGLSGIHSLAVGIEIESKAMPSLTGGSSSRGGSKGGGGRSGGGMPAGGRSGDGRPGGGQLSETGMPAQANPVLIWFEAKLYRNN